MAQLNQVVKRPKENATVALHIQPLQRMKPTLPWPTMDVTPKEQLALARERELQGGGVANFKSICAMVLLKETLLAQKP